MTDARVVLLAQLVAWRQKHLTTAEDDTSDVWADLRNRSLGRPVSWVAELGQNQHTLLTHTAPVVCPSPTPVTPLPTMSHYLFIVASAREPGHVGNTEWLARQAAAALPPEAQQTWLHLSEMALPAFVDQRHTAGTYPWPEGGLRTLLDATMACTDLVLVAPVYWFSFPSELKTYLDHWSAWLRIEGLPFKETMAGKRLHLITTSGNRAKAQPMIDSTRLCAEFLSMRFAGELWGKGGAPGAVQSDEAAVAAAQGFLWPCS